MVCRGKGRGLRHPSRETYRPYTYNQGRDLQMLTTGIISPLHVAAHTPYYCISYLYVDLHIILITSYLIIDFLWFQQPTIRSHFSSIFHHFSWSVSPNLWLLIYRQLMFVETLNSKQDLEYNLLYNKIILNSVIGRFSFIVQASTNKNMIIWSIYKDLHYQ